MQNYLFTLVSKNKKTGPIPVITSPKETCPSSCQWKKKGCYAKYGHLNIHWERITQCKTGVKFKELLILISRLGAGQIFRYAQAGDLPGKDNTISKLKLDGLIKANKNKRGFTYTHKPVLGRSQLSERNKKLIKNSNEKGFTINLSADNPSQADELLNLKIGPVVTIVDSNETKNSKTPAGNKILICPAVTQQYTTCSTCQICADSNRNYIIAFPAHGTAKKHINSKLLVIT